jgi:putative FmdB family regulatory protein
MVRRCGGSAGASPLPANTNTEENGKMPTYEYKCRGCGHTFEQKLTVSEHDQLRPKCPKCQSKKVEHAFNAFFAKTDSKT